MACVWCVYVYVCVSVHLYVMRACVRACVRVCVRACVRAWSPGNLPHQTFGLCPCYPRMPRIPVLSSLREVIGGFLEAVSVFIGEP